MNMKNITLPKRQSLATSAFEALMEQLGPQKTTQFWHTFIAPRGNYLKMRRGLFGRKNISALYREAKKFNRK